MSDVEVKPQALNFSIAKQISKRARRHSVVLFFAGAVCLFFVIEGGLSLWLGLLGFIIIFVSSFVYLERPLSINRAKRQLIKRYALRREGADLLPHATLLLGKDGNIRLANKAALELFQSAAATTAATKDLRGKPLSAVLREPSILDALGKSLKDNKERQRMWERTIPVQRFYKITIAPALNTKDNMRPFVLISFDDQTDVLLAEQMRADFIANASHELKTPLSVFTGYLETLRGLSPDDKDNREKFLGVMEKHSSRMVQLVDDLLSLSRIEQKEHILPDEAVVLEAVIADAIDVHRSVAEKLGMEIVYNSGTASDAIVSGSHYELSQALGNLLHNALTHGAARENGQKEVVISISPDSTEGQEAWAITIKDFGDGIDPHHLPRLTERFYRVNPEESRKLGGTGLGLAIVKHILTRHRGELRIQSKKGEGSAFSAVLPQKYKK